MKRKSSFAVVIPVLAALLASLVSHPHGMANLRFHLGLHQSGEMRAAVAETINQFNRNFATFFNTGGTTAILNEFPAENLIKRRIFQEIRQWDKQNLVMVYDKDFFQLESVDLVSPIAAVAVAREVWFLSAQDADTRKPVSTLKANPEKVRYFLRLQDSGWRVVEYEVFGENDEVPPVEGWRFGS